MKRIMQTMQIRVVAGVLALAFLVSAAPVSAQTSLFTTNLTIGSTGAQVTALQTFLINRGYSIPAITSGVATYGYFGVQTRAAVSAYQAANGIAPIAGYFGPLTRAHVNAVNPNGPNPTPNPTPGKELKGGEASLERFNLDGGDDNDVEENDRAEIAEIEFRVEDADVRVNRIDLSFEADPANAEDEPWDAFDTIRLLVDGDVIAEEDVSDEDDWLRDNEPFVFRFSGIDEIFREGDTATIVIEVEAQNGVLDGGNSDTWTIFVDDEGIRAEDGERLQQYVGDDNETVTFDIVEEGEGEELSIRTSSEDPDASTLQVEDDTRSDWYTVFVFELEAEDADIDLEQIAIDFTTGTADVNDVIDDLELIIDGESFDDFDWTGSGTFASSTFDIDGDFTLDEGDRVEVEVLARFKSANGANYAPGETIRASVNGDHTEGEGADDVTASGSATGDTHTLDTSGISVSRTDRSAQTTVADGADNDYATFRIEVDVTAFDQDVFIPINAAQAFTFEIQDASTGAVLGTSTATTSSVTASANSQGDYYRVNEGDTEEFSFTVTLNPLPENESRSYRMRLVTVEFADTASAPDQTWTALPANVYQTNSTYIND